MRDLLPEYAAETLDPLQRAQVECHLAGCAGCRTELAGWRAVAEAVPDVPDPPAVADLVHAVLASSALAPLDVIESRPHRRWSFAWRLLLAEARLTRLSVLVLSVVVVAFASVLALASPAGGPTAGDVLALAIPVVAAAGVGAVYAPERDPAFELTAVTPTAPGVVLLARVALILVYDLVLAGAASLVLSTTGGRVAGLGELIATWLGPMALLSTISLVLAVRIGSELAVGAALGLWALRVVVESTVIDIGIVADVVDRAWSTNIVTVLVAAGLGLLAVVLAARSEPGRRIGATHPA